MLDHPPAARRAGKPGVVVLLLDGDIPIWVIIVEVQLAIDDDKRARFYYDIVLNSLNEAARSAEDEPTMTDC